MYSKFFRLPHKCLCEQSKIYNNNNAQLTQMIRNKESIICHAMSLNESENIVYNLRAKRMIRENEKRIYR